MSAVDPLDELQRLTRYNTALEVMNEVLSWATKHRNAITENAKVELIAIATKYKDAP